MNSLTSIDTQLFSIIIFIVLAIVFHLISMRIRKIILTKNKAERGIRYYNALLSLLWISYLTVLYYRFALHDSSIFWIFLILVLIVFLFFFWYVLREIIAGFSVRLSYTIKKGQSIQFNQIHAVVNKLNLTSLELLKQNGNLYLIPWSKIINQSIEIVSVNESKNMFERKIKIQKTLPFDAIKKKLSYEIMLFPGTIASKKPLISLLDSSDHYEISLTLFTIDKASFDALINRLEKMDFKETDD